MRRLAPGGCNYDKIRMRKFKKKRPKEEVNILLTTRLQTHRANFKEDNEILKDKTNTALRNVNTSQLCDDKMLKVVDNRLRYQKSFRQSQENRSELENIPSRARQSRRDCVKILCKQSTLKCCIYNLILVFFHSSHFLNSYFS